MANHLAIVASKSNFRKLLRSPVHWTLKITNSERQSRRKQQGLSCAINSCPQLFRDIAEHYGRRVLSAKCSSCGPSSEHICSMLSGCANLSSSQWFLGCPEANRLLQPRCNVSQKKFSYDALHIAEPNLAACTSWESFLCLVGNRGIS